MPTPPFAHLGHWYVSLPIFMGPVLLIAVALKIQTWRERRHGPDISGKRSTVTVIGKDEQRTTIAIAGPLDYPALIELESALAADCVDAPAITLDLRSLTEADQEAAWSLCDTIGRSREPSSVEICIATTTSGAETLARTLAGEGIHVSHSSSPSPSTDAATPPHPTLDP
jgi:ABC-type transporter Mla MlaB component